MRHAKFSALTLLLLLAALAVLSACSPSAAPAGESGEASGTITLYTSVPQPIADKIQVDFQAQFSEITLEIFRAGTGEVVTKIATEKEAGGVQADLVWVAEPSTYEDFKAENLLLKFTPEGADALAPEMKDPDGYYYAGRLINMIIGYHTATASKPTSWADLVGGDYTTTGFPTPLRSGAAEAAVRALVDEFGWDYFESLAGNGGVQVQSNSTVRDQLATGELQAAALLDYMVRSAKDEGSPIDYVWPEEGTVLIPSPIAIFESSDNPAAAELFVEYILSVEGQRMMVELGSFYPVRDDVDPPPGAPPLSDIKTLAVDWKALRDNRQEIKEQWTAIFGE